MTTKKSLQNESKIKITIFHDILFKIFTAVGIKDVFVNPFLTQHDYITLV